MTTVINRRSALLAIGVAALCRLDRAAAAATDYDDQATKLISLSDAAGRTTTFSRDDLAALPQTRFATRAPWMTDPVDFSGPSIAALLEAFAPDATFERIEIVALDDYVASADVSTLVADGAILAIKQNGAFLPVAEKGPALMIFPFDDRPELADKPHFGLCIWQISQIKLS